MSTHSSTRWCKPPLIVVLFALLFIILTKNANGLLTARQHTEKPPCRQNLSCFPVDNDDCNNKSDMVKEISIERRNFVTALSSALLVTQPSTANAALFGIGGDDDRRQLELCLVSILRVGYFAETEAMALTSATGDPDEQKKPYLESRLGAKAALTKRVGGGATQRVYTLATLQLRGCLDDLVYYAKKNKQGKQAEKLRDDLIESLAAVVEFDGLETTTDPSPRSSLMLSQYNPSKAIFVQRMLSEQVVPTTKSLVGLFPEVREYCKTYVQNTFPNEVPQKKEIVPAETPAQE